MQYNFVVMETFGQWLRRHRKMLDLKQEDIAERAKVSVSYVSTLEREQPHSNSGKKVNPDRSKVAALAKAVQGDVNEALLMNGFSPIGNSASAKPILDAIAREGTLSEYDTILAANFIDMLKKQNKEKE